MPNVDGGHYFLTALAPVRTDDDVDHISKAARSHRHLLAQALALLPTGHQTPASPPGADPSPFSKNTLNHLARFAIIDGPAYNGRVSADTLLAKLCGIDPLTPQPVDRLNASYLLFAADIDARADGETGLRAYTDALWGTMRVELREVFGHCVGFDAVADAEAFHGYVKRCQIETTMPFNDYWPEGLQVKGLGWRWWAPLAVAGVAAVTLLASLPSLFAVGALAFGALRWGLLAFAAAVLAIFVAVFYRSVMVNGAKPFPTSPDSDLLSVLKALYLQQRFTRFAIDAQGLDEGELHARFKAFIAETAPAAAEPTQHPGAVLTPAQVPTT